MAKRKISIAASLGFLLQACQPCNLPGPEAEPIIELPLPVVDTRRDSESGSCVIIDGIGEISGADEYGSCMNGTPRDGIFTVQEIVNFWYRAARSDNWDNVALFAEQYDFDLNRFIREFGNNRSAVVDIDAICSGDINHRGEITNQTNRNDFGNYTRALAYVVRWSQDPANCAESYIPDNSANERRFSMGESLERIDFGGELTAEERNSLQRIITEDELREAFMADEYNDLYRRLRRHIDSFTENGACSNDSELLSIGQNQFRALYRSFVLAFLAEEQRVLFPVLDPGPTDLETDDEENPISYNFAQQRGSNGGRRVHLAADIYTSSRGRVQAMSNGIVIATSDEWTRTGNFRECDGPTGFVLINHPEMDISVLYGELNLDNVHPFDIGNRVSAGDIIGIARNCGMAHLEFYRGIPTERAQWTRHRRAQPGMILIGNDSYGTAPERLIDGSPLLWYLSHYRLSVPE